MKTISLSLFIMLFLTACSPKIGVGVGGVVISDDGLAVSEVLVDSQTGVHGRVTMGSDMRL